jgi:hypothetical protein
MTTCSLLSIEPDWPGLGDRAGSIYHVSKGNYLKMATYTLQDLLNRWARGEMDIEQMTGHILQHMIRLEVELEIVKQLLAKIEAAQKGAAEE